MPAKRLQRQPAGINLEADIQLATMFARKQTSVTALAVIGKDNPLVMLFAAHAVGPHCIERKAT